MTVNIDLKHVARLLSTAHGNNPTAKMLQCINEDGQL